MNTLRGRKCCGHHDASNLPVTGILVEWFNHIFHANKIRRWREKYDMKRIDKKNQCNERHAKKLERTFVNGLIKHENFYKYTEIKRDSFLCVPSITSLLKKFLTWYIKKL